MNRAVVTTDTLEEKLDKEFSVIFTGILAKVESFNKQKLTAKVQPLAKIETSDGFKSLPVVTLPVRTSFGDNTHIIPNFKRGDIVILVGGLYPNTNSIKGNFEQDLSRKHALENMVIIGGLYDSTSMNSNVIDDGLVICHEKSGARIVVKDEQVIIKAGTSEISTISSKIEIKQGSTSTQKTLLGEDTRDLLEKILDMILDVTVMTPAGPSSPISIMPNNKSKIEQIRAKLDSLLSPGVKNN